MSVTTATTTPGVTGAVDEAVTDAAGAVGSRREASWVYNAKGRLVHEAVVSDYDGDGPEPAMTEATDTTFDKLGYAQQKAVTVDFNGDGVPEQSETYTFGNDHKGRAVATTAEQDYDGDGVVDRRPRGRRLRRPGPGAA